MDYILGIDPGFSGALASLNLSDGSLNVFDMPIIGNKNGKTEINHRMLFELIAPPPGAMLMVVLEQVATMPGQGISSAFRFGQGYGALEMAIAAHQMQVRYTRPAQWKKHFGLSKDKGASRGLATQRFPPNAQSFSRVKDDGRAEAALIALYGKEVLK
jgi:crossover junction endodeoxyribonuclease RuvC